MNFLGTKTTTSGVGFQSASTLQTGAGTSNMLGNKPLFGSGTSSGMPLGGTSSSTNIQGTPTFGTGTTGFFNQPVTGVQPTTQVTGGQTTGLFPSTQPTGMFGGLPSTSNQPGMFQTAKPMTVGTGTTGIQTGGFPQGTNVGLNTVYQPIQQQNQPQYQHQPGTQVFTLLPTNFLKYDKVESLQDDIKRILKEIETSFKNNDLYLEQEQNIIDQLYENYKVLNIEGVKVVKYSKVLNSKKSKINFLMQNLKLELEEQIKLLEMEKRSYHLLNGPHSIKINIPSEFFLNMTKEVEDTINFQAQQISDLEAIMTLHYRKESGSFKANSDIIEETIREIYACLICLVNKAASLSENVLAIKQIYMEMMKAYNWRDNELESRLRNFALVAEDDKEKQLQKETGMKF